MKYEMGFQPVSAANTLGACKIGVSSAVTIAKGDVIDSTAGYATLATALSTSTIGVALHDANNSAGASGAIDVLYMPIDANVKYIAPVEANTGIAVANVGLMYDLSSEDGITLADTTITRMGFRVDDYDASAAAVAANTYGFAIGHFTAVT